MDTHQTMTIEIINTLGLTVEEVMELTGLSQATIKKFMKGGNVAGRTICNVWDEVKAIDENLKAEMLKKYNMEF